MSKTQRLFLIFFSFIIGIIVGAGGLYLYSAYQARIFLAAHGTLSSLSPSGSPQSAGPTQPVGASPSPSSSSSAKNLLGQIFGQGISLTDTVDSVYPKAGFIISDNNNVKMFVAWNSTEPAVGSHVTVAGKLQNAQVDSTALKSLPGFTSSLQAFLQTQPIYLQATSVNQAQ